MKKININLKPLMMKMIDYFPSKMILQMLNFLLFSDIFLLVTSLMCLVLGGWYRFSLGLPRFLG